MPSSTKSPPKPPVPDEIARALDAWLGGHGGMHNISTNTFQFSSFAIGLSMACALVVVVGFIVMAIEFNRQDKEIDRLGNQLRDNQAWVGVYGNKISTLEARMETSK